MAMSQLDIGDAITSKPHPIPSHTPIIEDSNGNVTCRYRLAGMQSDFATTTSTRSIMPICPQANIP